MHCLCTISNISNLYRLQTSNACNIVTLFTVFCLGFMPDRLCNTNKTTKRGLYYRIEMSGCTPAHRHGFRSTATQIMFIFMMIIYNEFVMRNDCVTWQRTCDLQVAGSSPGWHHCVVALGKLLTLVCLCHQAV